MPKSRASRPRSASLVMAVAAAALLLAACGGGSSGATAPTNGEVVHGTTVKVRLKLTGARIVIPTSTHIVPTQGHVHLLLDGQIVSMNYSLENTLGGLKPGQHLLRAEFVASDHLPWDPRIFDAVVFEVAK